MPHKFSSKDRGRGKGKGRVTADAMEDVQIEPRTFTPDMKDATQSTISCWNNVSNTLNFGDTSDYDHAQRGLLNTPSDLIIFQDGQPVWDMKSYADFIKQNTQSPQTVNPSLWRMSQLNMFYGLFEVTENIYQVRGYDLSNISFVKGSTGWIVFDPLISAECSQAALSLINQEVYEKNGDPPQSVSAVIYSHSHIDHFGGVKGVLGPNDKDNIPIYASKGFTEHAVSENVIAGNAMSRRAIFMYGSLLEKSAKGSVCAGLGMTTSSGSTGLLKPTKIISDDYETIDVDGVKMEFQFTPGTEAPTEMNTWFVDWNVLWMAENTTHTMHNLLTLRGAQVRDALMWSEYLTKTINRYGATATVKFQSHHWPLWGNDEIMSYLKKQRAIYQYTHDQSVRLMNKGYVGTEIASAMQLPKSLELEWSTRGYYGTLSHNSHAVYQRYMGWYSGNPSDLNKLPQEEAGAKYVSYMGTEENVIEMATVDFDQGNYRWVAEVMRHVVFKNPDNDQARYLLADTYEQMGYQAESGAWRACYLQGAHELRNPKPTSGLSTISEDVVRNMEPSMLFTYWGVHLNPAAAQGMNLNVVINLTDTDLGDDISTTYTLTVEDCVLIQSPEAVGRPDATITTPMSKLYDLFLTQDVDAFLNDPLVEISDDEKQYVVDLVSVFDTKDDMWFNIIEP
ncbi:unnamed protein product [Agarophyton chilense]|eukprot:gb/GEZJ01003795.1/.p1 GENE.gb/GEZJ01003795.1/~~gb/GEZJ01003795.1/.p1  ORF type:complete len:677 (+),score=73.44 gb/GEZJ01003795.1/:1418-3448(+)